MKLNPPPHVEFAVTQTSAEDRQPKIVIIGGCARSGTTGFQLILNEDKRPAIGRERYLRLSAMNMLTADLWTKERFIDVRRGDTQVQLEHPTWSIAYEIIRRVEESYGVLAYVGDKLPRAARCYESLLASAPKAKILYMLRNPFDVAASYNKRARNPNDTWRSKVDYREAVAHWNFDVSETAKYLDKIDFLILRYETIFQKLDEFKAVYDFLGLKLLKDVRIAWDSARDQSGSREEQRSALTDEEKVYICKFADFDSYRQLLKRVKMAV